jgi:putative endonuclease
LIVAERTRDPRQALGQRGEAAAERSLIASGFEILERRCRFRVGEIDLVATDGETLVFVEVKARSGTGYGTPAASVTPAKQRRIARVALTFLSRRRWLDRRCRFDVVEIFASEGRVRRVNHIRDAFRL